MTQDTDSGELPNPNDPVDPRYPRYTHAMKARALERIAKKLENEDRYSLERAYYRVLFKAFQRRIKRELGVSIDHLELP